MKTTSPAFFIDLEICTGCKTCMVACKDKNDLAPGIRWRRVYEFTGGQWISHADGTYTQDVITYYLSIGCNHCDDPACVKACPTKAMIKDASGVVYIDDSRCVGCRYCEWACPYSAPQFNIDRGVMSKCNFCRTEVMEGDGNETTPPACVAACPTRALRFGNYDTLQKELDGSSEIAPLPDATLTSPHLLIHPAEKQVVALNRVNMSKKNGKQANGMISNPEEVKNA